MSAMLLQLLMTIVRVGIDLAKNVIQVHAVDRDGRRVVARALRPEQLLGFCRQLPKGCLVAMEACGSAHHWGRQLLALGLDARLIAGHLVTPYRMEGRGAKNDANDAAAICEAASRPSMRFVPIKSAEQQALVSVHTWRSAVKEERTACICFIRSQLAEFGIVFAKSPKVLRAKLADTLEDADNGLPGLARLVLQEAFEHWRALDERMKWCDQRVGEHVRSCPQARAAARIVGIGPLGASAHIAKVGDFTQFDSGKQFASWEGLVPRQNSSGGKLSLGGITKRGDEYLRTLLIQGAKSAVLTAQKRKDPISRWVLQLRERVGWQKACVALANKNARILWAMMTRDKPYDPNHVPATPGAKTGQPAAARGAPALAH
jgi:transposase